MLTILEVHDDARHRARQLAARPREPGLRWVIVQPDRLTWSEAHEHDLIIEHVEAPLRLGSRTRRALLRPEPLLDLVALHRPSAIVCGATNLVPVLVQLAAGRLQPRPALIGAVHAGPRVEPRGLARFDPRLAQLAARASSWWSTQSLLGLDAVFVGSADLARQLRAQGVDRIYHTPRGVDVDEFSPAHRELQRVGELAGDGARPIVGVAIAPETDAALLRRLHAALQRCVPSQVVLVILAPEQVESRARLERFVDGFDHVHLPDVTAPHARARVLAACDVVVTLDDDGVAIAEAMACARPVVAAAGYPELVREAGCGRVLERVEAQPIAQAVAACLRDDNPDELGARGRTYIEAFELRGCLARELACVREVIEHVRAGQRVPTGIHERALPKPT